MKGRVPNSQICLRLFISKGLSTLLLFLCLLTIPTLALSSSPNAPEKNPNHRSGTYSVYGETAIKAGLSFPPFTNSRQQEFTLNAMSHMGLDRMRIAIDWRNREPVQGSFFWDPMDQRMQRAKDSSIKVFLTILSIGPEWACLPSGKDGAYLFDEVALKGFFDSILSRYDTIDKIQFGNEWEAGKNGYTDKESLKKFVHYTNMLYEAVQEHSPQTQVVLGGLTRLYPLIEKFGDATENLDFSPLHLGKGWSRESLLKRIEKDRAAYQSMQIQQNIMYVFEHASYDVLDVHLYDDAENWEAYLSVLPKDVPIVVSEFGGPSSEFEQTQDTYHAKRMEAYIDAIESLPITEAYYFKLVDSDESYHKHSGLYTKSLRKKPAYKVFTQRLSPTV